MQNIIKKAWLFVILGILPLTKTFAFWEAGHMAVADIAYNQLSNKAKQKINQLMKLMSVESTVRHDYSYNEASPNYTFMALSVWQDDIKAYPNYLKMFSTWHYIEDAYSEDGTDVPNVIPRDNVIWSVENTAKHLRQENANEYAKARSLAMLIHFVGDIHQPLHCAEYYSEQFPNGDRGGNSYRIYYKEPDGKKIYNLHMLLDSGVNLFTDLGYSQEVHNPKDIDEIAQLIMKDYPKNYFADKANNLDPHTWEAESHLLAIDAHHTPYDKNPSASFLDEQTIVIEKQIALAGYRLGQLLNEILG